MNIYNFSDYRDLIDELLRTKIGRGSKAQLAQLLNCRPGYISQVLNKKNGVHFGPENIIRISEFVGLDADETDYLLSLLSLERAGSKELENHLRMKIRKVQAEHLSFERNLKKRTGILDEESRSTYYSHWAYCAVHMLVSISQYQTVEKILSKLKIEEKFLNGVLKFLVDRGLVKKDGTRYSTGETRIHLDKKSPQIKSHHQNFRIKAIQSLENENDFDLHYSSVMTLSKKDALKMRELILSTVAAKDELLIPSPNEDIICLNIDLFRF